ncbi:MAG: MacS family sensor histidine kinase [Micromonosporaceae bacterium]
MQAWGVPLFEVPLWRALAVFRLATLGYAAVLVARNFAAYDHPYAGWAVIAVMAAWSVVSVSVYARPRARGWPLLLADVAVTAACLLASRRIVGPDALAHGMATLPVTWMACPVLAVAVARGRRWGAATGVAMGACDLLVRAQLNQATLTGTVIMVLAGVAVGHVARLAVDVQQRLQRAAELEAATRERERLARGIHDSVLQVLALVQHRGAELGGEAAELGRLAGEQEVALRALVGSGPPEVSAEGLVDLRAVLGPVASATVSLAAPATGVWLPARAAHEVAAVVGAALENVRAHAGPGARAWVLVEDEPEAVTVTVRDDGIGIADGRLEQAVGEGRLGVAQSIRGRVRDLGGGVTITSVPGEGTEVELRLPRASVDVPVPRRPIP